MQNNFIGLGMTQINVCLKKAFFVAIETAATSLKARLHQTRPDLFVIDNYCCVRLGRGFDGRHPLSHPRTGRPPLSGERVVTTIK